MSNSEKTSRTGKRQHADRPFAKSAAAASWIFGLVIVGFLMLIVIYVDVDPGKQPIIRFLMALAAAFTASFFLGNVVLKGTVGGMQISAAGGIALFILIQFVFDPFRVLPSRSSAAQPSVSPTATQSPTPTPSPTQKANNSTATKPGATPITTTTSENEKSAKVDVGQTLNKGDAWTDSGNPRDKEKALQLYRSAIPHLNCAHLPRDLLAQAEDAYAKNNFDSALEKYRAVLRVCQDQK